MIDLSVNNPVSEDIYFDASFDAIWQDIEAAQDGLYFDNRVLPTRIEVTRTGKDWLKRHIIDSYETVSSLKSRNKRKNHFIRCNTETSSIVTEITISKEGIATNRKVVTPAIEMFSYDAV